MARGRRAKELAVIADEALARAQSARERAEIDEAGAVLAATAKTRGGPAFELTDDGNVNRYLAVWRDTILWCGNQGAGSFWCHDRGRWAEDRDNSVPRRARAIVRALEQEQLAAPGWNDDFTKWRWRSQELRAQSRIVEGLKARVGFDPDRFDPPETDLWLNTPSGRVYLVVEGQVLPHDPSLRITRLTTEGWRPGDDCPGFRKAVDTWMRGRPELVDHLQRLLGASLLPGMLGRYLIILYGPSSQNGKSTLMEILGGVLGDYAGTLATDALMEQRNRATHDEALSPLIGRRLVFASEGSERMVWNTTLVKLLTGGETISLRRIRGMQRTVRPTWTVFLATNHAPNLGTVDPAIRQRLRFIPFDHHVPPEDRIPDLAQQLVDTEGPGILNWLLEGLWKVHRDGGIGEPPAEVRALTDEYFEAADELGRYLEERTLGDGTDPYFRIGATRLYEDYLDWCAREGLRPLTSTAFGLRLNQRGISKVKDSHGRNVRVGLTLAGSEEAASG